MNRLEKVRAAALVSMDLGQSYSLRAIRKCAELEYDLSLTIGDGSAVKKGHPSQAPASGSELLLNSQCEETNKPSNVNNLWNDKKGCKT